MLEFFSFLIILLIVSIIFYYLLKFLFFKKREIPKEKEYLENLKIEKIEGEEKKEKLTIDDLIEDFLQKRKEDENYLLEKRIKEVIKKAEDLFKEIEEYESKKN